MAWVNIKYRGGFIKIKPRWQMRSKERNREIPVLFLGPIIISYWRTEDHPHHVAAADTPTPTSPANSAVGDHVRQWDQDVKAAAARAAAAKRKQGWPSPGGTSR